MSEETKKAQLAQALTEAEKKEIKDAYVQTFLTPYGKMVLAHLAQELEKEDVGMFNTVNCNAIAQYNIGRRSILKFLKKMSDPTPRKE